MIRQFNGTNFKEIEELFSNATVDHYQATGGYRLNSIGGYFNIFVGDIVSKIKGQVKVRDAATGEKREFVKHD